MELYFLLLLMVLMAAALGSGYPVAFALPGSAIITVGLAALCGYMFAGNVDAYFADGGPSDWLSAGVTNFRGVYWVPERDTLIAIPLFIFMGIMLQRSRIAEDLLVTMAQLFGPMPGGLGISVIIVGALLAATTGIVGATVVAMGLISLPAMLRNNYSHSLATGTISASGTLGQIIPPSIVLIILADQLASATDQASTARKTLYKETTGDFSMPSAFDVVSTSAGEMFLGALFPGLILVLLYIGYVAIFALLRPHLAPAVPYEGKYDSKFAGKVFMALVPPLALIIVVLGSIIMGVATVNQAGSIGAAGALIMAGYRLYEGRGRYLPAIIAIASIITIVVVAQINPINIRKLDTADDVFWFYVSVTAVVTLIGSLIVSGMRAYKIDDTLRSVMLETAKTTSLVFIILLGAAMLTSAFRGFGGEELVKHSLSGLPGGFWGQFMVVMLVIFILGFFLDFIEIAVVVVPIIAPILLADPSANVTAVWLGVMIGMNMQTSFLTPPFGFALFYLRGVAPAVVKTISMYKGVIAFIGLQIAGLIIVAFNPQLVNYLPQRVALTSETAPPPLNPRLQYCLENNLFRHYKSKEQGIMQSIAAVKGLDYSMLPEDLRSELTSGFGKAEATFGLVAKIQGIQSSIDKQSTDYRPLHIEVRSIQRSIRQLKAEIKILNDEIRGSSEAEEKRIKAKIAELEGSIKAQEASIPENWSKENKAFAKLLKDEKFAQLKYRRNVDSAYTSLTDAIAVIASYENLKGLGAEIDALPGIVDSKSLKEAHSAVGAVRQKVGKVAGASKLRSALYKAVRALKGREANAEKAKEELAKSLEIFKTEVEWRGKAHAAVLTKLQAYEASIRNNIGLRKQSRMPESFALELVGCSSQHRDLTLRF